MAKRKRIVHLARFAKKARTRKKNMHRLDKIHEKDFARASTTLRNAVTAIKNLSSAQTRLIAGILATRAAFYKFTEVLLEG